MIISLLARRSLFTQRGGDTVQVEQTAAALRKEGHDVHILSPEQTLPSGTEILHAFNLARPEDYRAFQRFPGKKVLSSIYVDYSLADQNRFPFLFKVFGKHGLEYLKVVSRGINGTDRFPTLSYLLKGQKKSIAQMLSKTDVLITSSQSELDRIKLDFPEFPAQNHIIPLGISAAFLNTHHFNQERKGILLLGRLEWLKNQKPFIEWAAKYNWPLTVVGDANVNQPNYYKECREVAGPNTTFLPFTKESEVVQLMQQHSILVVPSLFETYSLVGWEACAQGMHVLFNDVPDMSETLAPVGSAVDFSDENEVRKAIEIALEEPTETQKKSQELAQRHSWDLIIQQILKAYA